MASILYIGGNEPGWTFLAASHSLTTAGPFDSEAQLNAAWGAGHDLIVYQTSGAPAMRDWAAAKYASGTPLLIGVRNPQLAGQLGLTATTVANVGSQSSITALAVAHPILDGRTGSVNTGASGVWHHPPATWAGTRIASQNSGTGGALVAVETGDALLTSGTAPARAVTFSWERHVEAGGFSASGQALLLDAIDWLLTTDAPAPTEHGGAATMSSTSTLTADGTTGTAAPTEHGTAAMVSSSVLTTDAARSRPAFKSPVYVTQYTRFAGQTTAPYVTVTADIPAGAVILLFEYMSNLSGGYQITEVSGLGATWTKVPLVDPDGQHISAWIGVGGSGQGDITGTAPSTGLNHWLRAMVFTNASGVVSQHAFSVVPSGAITTTLPASLSPGGAVVVAATYSLGGEAYAVNPTAGWTSLSSSNLPSTSLIRYKTATNEGHTLSSTQSQSGAALLLELQGADNDPPASVAMKSGSTLSSGASVGHQVQATMTATSVLAAPGTVAQPAESTMTSTSTLQSEAGLGNVVVQAAVALTALSLLQTTGTVGTDGTVDMTATSELSLEMTASILAVALLVATSVLKATAQNVGEWVLIEFHVEPEALPGTYIDVQFPVRHVIPEPVATHIQAAAYDVNHITDVRI